LGGVSTLFELVFFTSSRIKTQHARYLSRNYDIKVVNFKELRANANYDEPRIRNRDELLRISFENARKQAEISKLGKNKAFIIEDTSVDIYALSEKNKIEFPGVDIKYWMRETTFSDLDLELSMTGGSRIAKVRSDLVLYLPRIRQEPFYFFGETLGTVTSKESEFDTNPIYPWLDNVTFNKWFIPNGETSVISQLPIEKADIYDFRRKPFEELLDLLHKKRIVKRKSELRTEPYQRPIENHHFHFVSGLTCAGKTTIANYLVEELDFLHIEASDFMHEIYRENHGVEGKVDIGTFAKEILKVTPTVVAERVTNYLKSYEAQDLVITGFRLLEEINYVKAQFPLLSNFNLIVIEAEQQVRELRKAARSRDVKNIENLIERDKRELSMGMSKLVEYPDSVIVENSGTFEKLFENYKRRLGVEKVDLNLQKFSDVNSLPLQKLIILALYVAREQQREKSDYFSTTEICRQVNNLGVEKPKFVNNIGRFFSQKTNVLFEVKKYKRGKKYRLSNTGAGYAKVILRTFKFSEKQQSNEKEVKLTRHP
jgi:inosine/xanthosine triphosphate pyrophosphatase family protein/adenylate kinase family enzyme